MAGTKKKKKTFTRKPKQPKQPVNASGNHRGVVKRASRPRTASLGARGLCQARTPKSKRCGFKGESIYAGIMDKMADLAVGKEITLSIPSDDMSIETWHTRLAQVMIKAKIKPRPGFKLRKRSNEKRTGVIVFWAPTNNAK